MRHLPLSEEAYLRLGETTDRAELFDGSLYLSPRGQPRHQFIVGRLMDALQPPAAAAGLHVLGAVNLRLGKGRIVNPDVVMTRPIGLDEPIVDVRSVALVAEVAARSDEVCRILKHHFYKIAGVPWFLRVDVETGMPHLHRLITNGGAEWPAIDAIQPEDLLPPG